MAISALLTQTPCYIEFLKAFLQFAMISDTFKNPVHHNITNEQKQGGVKEAQCDVSELRAYYLGSADNRHT